MTFVIWVNWGDLTPYRSLLKISVKYLNISPLISGFRDKIEDHMHQGRMEISTEKEHEETMRFHQRTKPLHYRDR